MNYLQVLGLILVAYLLGSLNFAIVFSKLFFKLDIRKHGSNNAGTTNVLRIMGKKWAIWVLVLDMLKAVIAVLIGGAIFGPYGKLLAGVFVILGHIFPLYFNFKGGKGVASSAGIMLAFDLRIFLIIAIIFFSLIFITKMVSLASMVASAFLPFGMYIFYKDFIFVLIGLSMAVGIIYMHRANIKRIISGDENKLSFKKKWGYYEN